MDSPIATYFVIGIVVLVISFIFERFSREELGWYFGIIILWPVAVFAMVILTFIKVTEWIYKNIFDIDLYDN